MKFVKRAFEIIILITIFLCCGVAVSATESKNAVGPDDFEGKKIGVVTTSNFVDNVYKMFENPDVTYYQSVFDLVLALTSGKVDAIAVNDAVIRYSRQDNPNMDYFSVGTEKAEKVAFITSSSATGKKYQKELNAFLKKLKENGKLVELQEKWFDGKGDQSMLDYSELPAENGILNIASNSVYAPFDFIRDDKIVGYEIEILALFCKENGYGMKVENVDYDGVVAGVVSEKFDIGSSACNITENSEEFVNFTTPDYECPLAAAYLTESKVDTSLFDGKKIAIQSDTVYVDTVYDIFDNPNVTYYLSQEDIFNSVASGEVDCCLTENTFAEYYLPKYEELDYINLDLNYSIGFASAKDDAGIALINKFNQFLKKKEESGELQELQTKWMSGPESERKMSVDYHDLSGENGTLSFAVCSDYPPLNYKKDGMVVGYEIELATLFCLEKGYKLDITEVDFSDLIVGASSGQYDLSASSLIINAEREQKVTFSNPIFHCNACILYRDEDVSSGESLPVSLKNRLVRTFLSGNRMNLFLSGVLTTILISVLSVVLGFAIGFTVYLAYRKNYKVVIKISKGVKWVVQGMPEVVLLMILFYVVFAKTDLSAVVVAIIGFILIFSCPVLDLLQAGEKSVDPGQIIAAKSLGYSDSMAFFKIILPQSAISFLPSLQNEIVTIIKSTSIVGYIAVVDITKVADVIRGSTYDALAPLIAVAIVYIALTYFSRYLIQQIEKKVNPKNRTEEKITKGFIVK